MLDNKLVSVRQNLIEIYMKNINYKLGKSKKTAIFELPIILDTGDALEIFIDFIEEENKIKLSNNCFFELQDVIRGKDKDYLKNNLRDSFKLEKRKFLFENNIKDDIYFSKIVNAECNLTKEIFDYAIGVKFFFDSVYNVLMHRLSKTQKEYTFTEAIDKVIKKFELKKENNISRCEVYKIKEDYLVSANDKEHLAFILYELLRNNKRYNTSYLLLQNKKIGRKTLKNMEKDFNELRITPYSVNSDMNEIENKVKEILVKYE